MMRMLTDQEIDCVAGGLHEFILPGTAAKNPNLTRFPASYTAPGEPGSTEFGELILGEPEGGGRFPQARIDNNPG
jgi:hypothetical protein